MDKKFISQIVKNKNKKMLMVYDCKGILIKTQAYQYNVNDAYTSIKIKRNDCIELFEDMSITPGEFNFYRKYSNIK